MFNWVLHTHFSNKVNDKTLEQRQANHSCAFIVDFEGRHTKVEINRWLNNLIFFFSSF